MNGVMDVVKVSDVRIRKSNLCVKRKQQKLINFSMDKKELYRFNVPYPHSRLGYSMEFRRSAPRIRNALAIEVLTAGLMAYRQTRRAGSRAAPAVMAAANEVPVTS